MFPFGNSSNGIPILHCSSVVPSFHNSSSSFLGLNGNQVLLHPHQDQVSNLIDNSSSMVFANYNFINNNKSNNQDRSLNKIKKTVKKDRHSKILTSQGHRDRRVRLSIGIARKFFDLQDMLGVDKPSKTLDWLFTKSKLAIEELTDQNAKIKSTTPSINSECEDNVVVNAAAVSQQVKDKEVITAKESRAKARARARERTIKKFWTQIEAKSNSRDQTNMEQIKEMVHPHIKSSLGFHRNLNGPNKVNHDDVNRTIITSNLSAPIAATIFCTSPQVQKAWDSYRGNHI